MEVYEFVDEDDEVRAISLDVGVLCLLELGDDVGVEYWWREGCVDC